MEEGGSKQLPELELLAGELESGGGSADRVDSYDLSYVMKQFGRSVSGQPMEVARADITGDGCVDLLDLVAVVLNWHKWKGDYQW